MPARHHSLGEPAHEAERQAIRLIVESLPEDYIAYSNAWLVERTGVVHELDVVVVAPHCLYVVELKAYRGAVCGTDHDGDLPQGPIRSPLKKNRHTAQVLAKELKHLSEEAARRWVEHFVFPSHASSLHVDGPASSGRLHTRHTLLKALQDVRGFRESWSSGVSPEVDEHTLLHRVGQHRAILRAEPFFGDEAGRLCLPLENFQGVTLPTWLTCHSKQLAGREDRYCPSITGSHYQPLTH